MPKSAIVLPFRRAETRQSERSVRNDRRYGIRRLVALMPALDAVHPEAVPTVECFMQELIKARLDDPAPAQALPDRSPDIALCRRTGFVRTRQWLEGHERQ